jgi:hypothetical protein
MVEPKTRDLQAKSACHSRKAGGVAIALVPTASNPPLGFAGEAAAEVRAAADSRNLSLVFLERVADKLLKRLKLFRRHLRVSCSVVELLAYSLTR